MQVTLNLYEEFLLENPDVSVYVNDRIMEIGDIANIGDVVKLVLDDGFKFIETPRMYYQSNIGDMGHLDFVNHGTYAEFKIEEIESNLLEYRPSGTELEFYLAFEDLRYKQLTDVTGSNAIYIINQSDLKTINTERNQVTLDNSGTVKLDYGINIIGVINIPFKISDDIILKPEYIKMGSLKLGVQGLPLSKDKYTHNFGDIVIPEINSDIYNHVIGFINLPYVPRQDIDLKYLSGQTINISYIVDLYSGNVNILVKSSLSNSIVLNINADFGVDVPYVIDNFIPKNENLNIVLGADNGIRTPFIELITNEIDVKLKDSIFNVQVIDEGFLSNGYIEVENIKLECKASLTELNDINSYLKSGIFIK